MKSFFFWWGLVVVLLTTFPARAQYFHDRYADVGGRQSYLGPAVATDSGFVVSGQVNDYGANQRPAIQLRGLTPDGRTRWLRTYWRAEATYYGPLLKGLLPIAGGGYAMCGSLLFSQPGGNGYRAMLWRFTAQGDTLWKRIYPSAVPTIAWGMCATSDGGYVLVGGALQHRPNGTEYQQAMLLRVDAAGNVVWQRTYGTHDYTWTALVTATPDGGFLVTGNVRTPISARYSQSYVLKVDGAGAVQWQKFLGDATVLNGAGANLVTGDGNYVVAANAGRPLINDRGRGRQSLYKFRPDGTEVWHRELGPVRKQSFPCSALELADGSLVVAGQIGREDSLGTNDVSYEAFAYKVCADGDSVWYRTYRLLNGPRSDHYLQGFCAAPNGGFLGTGYLFPYLPDTGTSDGWAFRTDSLGYLVAGGAPPARICPRPTWLGVAPDAGGAGAGVSVYPNPSASGRYTLGGATGAEAEVRDALGRLVYRQTVGAGAETALDLSATPPGLYLLRLRWGAERTVMIKLVK